jgi:hypothetical protein
VHFLQAESHAPGSCRSGQSTVLARDRRAKRRLVSQLLAMELPVKSKTEDPERGLAFDLLRAPAGGAACADGPCERLDHAERRGGRRRQARADPAPAARALSNLLGHFRHEVGHYYWDRLIPGPSGRSRSARSSETSAPTTPARSRRTTRAAHRPDWRDRHISAYASSHPGKTGARRGRTSCTSRTASTLRSASASRGIGWPTRSSRTPGKTCTRRTTPTPSASSCC